MVNPSCKHQPIVGHPFFEIRRFKPGPMVGMAQSINAMRCELQVMQLNLRSVPSQVNSLCDRCQQTAALKEHTNNSPHNYASYGQPSTVHYRDFGCQNCGVNSMALNVNQHVLVTAVQYVAFHSWHFVGFSRKHILLPNSASILYPFEMHQLNQPTAFTDRHFHRSLGHNTL